VFTFEMYKIYKRSTLSLIGVEGYSTPVGKWDRRDPARSASGGSGSTLTHRKASSLERKSPHFKCHNIHKDFL